VSSQVYLLSFIYWSFLALPPSEWLRYKALFTTLQATIY